MLKERRPGAVSNVLAGRDAARLTWRDWWTWAIAVTVFGAYATLSLYRYFTLTPMSWDLGIYTEYVKQYADLHAPIVDIRGAGFNLLGDHFQPIVALIAPFFRIFPTPATLLVAQALLTAVSVFPVVTAGRALLGPRRARAVGLAYGFSWGLQQMINFDFHEIAFAVLLLAFSMSALVRGRYKAAVVWALPLVFVKEDQGFTVAAIGLLLAIAGWRARDRVRIRGGALLVVWGLAWSIVAITVIIPHFNPQHDYYYWKDGGTIGPGGPSSALAVARQTLTAWPEKLQTTMLLLLPTAFLALGSPVALLVLPSLALRFVSSNSAYWGTMWHYDATVMPILFIAAIEVMRRWDTVSAPGTEGAGTSGQRDSPGASTRTAARPTAVLRAAAARHGPAMMLAVAVAMAFHFPVSDVWNGSTYTITPHVTAADAAMAKVPDGATVTTTLDLLAPLAGRTDTFWIGNPGNPKTTYVVFDGQDSGYSPAPSDVPAFVQQLFPGDGYRPVFSDDDVYVFKRG
jgi:uncharacterized membrane protein